MLYCVHAVYVRGDPGERSASEPGRDAKYWQGCKVLAGARSAGRGVKCWQGCNDVAATTIWRMMHWHHDADIAVQ
jgi:hypothetical protein